ncbi:MAG: hypothetical protein U9Q67_00115 [Patescibacteria group bacterium]|nr:hypothetical protein [Patescibacteria group bacterium]
MSKLSQEEKDAYMAKVQKLMIEYFLREKVETHLTKKQLKQLVDKYPPDKGQNVDAFMQAVGELLPKAPEMFTEAMIEVKARLVVDQYKKKKKGYEELLKDATSEESKAIIKRKIAECEVNLKFIKDEKWEFVAGNVAQSKAVKPAKVDVHASAKEFGSQ